MSGVAKTCECHHSAGDWQKIGHEYDEVRDCMLGWDITDYGLGDFDKVGFLKRPVLPASELNGWVVRTAK